MSIGSWETDLNQNSELKYEIKNETGDEEWKFNPDKGKHIYNTLCLTGK